MYQLLQYFICSILSHIAFSPHILILKDSSYTRNLDVKGENLLMLEQWNKSAFALKSKYCYNEVTVISMPAPNGLFQEDYVQD